MTWAKVINGGRTDILTNQNGKVTMHSKKFKRYSSKKNFLIINKVLRSDAGRFYCNENAVDLGVVTGTRSDNKTSTYLLHVGSERLNVFVC